jgi:chromatin remodeling complex protein RSC6
MTKTKTSGSKKSSKKTTAKKSPKKPLIKTPKKAIKKTIKKTIKKPIEKTPEASPTSDFEDKIEELKEALKENYVQQKKLMNELNILMSLHKKEVKTAIKMSKGSAGKLSGFNKPEPIPEPLRELLDIENKMLPRAQVTKSLYKYIKDNEMYNANTKREIVPNKEMKEIFGIKKGDTMTFYNFQTWLKKVYDENTVNEEQPGNVLVIDD